MSKKTVVILLIVIVLGIICGIWYSKSSNKPIFTNSDLNEESKNVIANEEVENMEIENIIDEENKDDENENKQEENTETYVETPKSDAEKAIDIVKKDWGDTSGVTISHQGTQTDGKEVVVVSSQGRTLAFYYVNVSKGTFIKEDN